MVVGLLLNNEYMSTTKIHRIVAMDICQSHPNKKAYQTDAYYAKLANQLLDDF